MTHPTVDYLIDKIPGSTAPMLQGINPDVVRAIIEFGHIHVSDTFPEHPAYGRSGTVITPDHQQHIIDVKADGGSHERNRVCCLTCWPDICEAAIAVFIVELSEWLQEIGPLEDRENRCPICQERLDTSEGGDSPAW